MKATYMFGAGDVRIVDAPEPKLVDPTDAVLRIVRACVCGSDLHPITAWRKTPTGCPWVTNSSASSKRSTLALGTGVQPGRISTTLVDPVGNLWKHGGFEGLPPVVTIAQRSVGIGACYR
jgi:hypothetical protein